MEDMLLDKAIEPVQEMLDRMNANAVFGTPSSEGDTTIIPVASTIYGFGYGFGGGLSDESGENSGGGGGGGGRTAACGYIEITPEGVQYVPTTNDTLVAVMGMLTGMWSIAWLALTVITIARGITKVRGS